MIKNNTGISAHAYQSKQMKGAAFKRMILLSTVFFLLSLRGSVTYSPATYEKQDLLYWAELLVSHINAQNTDYRHRETSVQWAKINGAGTYESFADCSGFINALFKQTYGWDEKYFKSWLGRARPLAYHYYDAIFAEKQFTIIRNINDIQPGDLIAIKYNDRSDHDDNTGHLLLVSERPQHHNATVIVEPGTEQYEITIIDASKSPHGKSDSRHNTDGSAYAGLGKGLFRLYADEQGAIKGYSWSVERPKIDFDPFGNPVIIGRIKE